MHEAAANRPPTTNRIRLVCLGLLAVLGLSCAREEGPSHEPETARRTITVAEIPPNVMEAARKQLPDVDFQEAWRNVRKDDSLHSYEVRGRAKNGKIREVRVSPTGEILEME